MMRIAIADDLSADAGKLREFICRWAREQGIVLVPAPADFESGEESTGSPSINSPQMCPSKRYNIRWQWLATFPSCVAINIVVPS